MYAYVCTHIHVFMYLCTYVCMYVGRYERMCMYSNNNNNDNSNINNKNSNGILQTMMNIGMYVCILDRQNTVKLGPNFLANFIT